MIYKIKQWNSIKDEFKRSTLIIGNGASIALDPNFAYSSLMDYAKSNQQLTEDVLSLFEYFKTNDFEHVLRLVWHAAVVNNVLEITDKRTNEAYENVRNALIKTVRTIHSGWDEISTHFDLLYNFTKEFRTIISLNYDLILYWIIMYGNNQRDGHIFKDCFIAQEFKEDWENLRNSIGESINTLVFYPHGNLCLVRNINDLEFKVNTLSSSNLLNTILQRWESTDYVPLFICEGTKDKKMEAIKRSPYLYTVYSEVLPKVWDKSFAYSNSFNLVIYGWSIGEHDHHIIERILDTKMISNLNDESIKIAIALYNTSQSECHRIEKIIKEALGVEVLKLKLYFFSSKDSGCWNNP